MSIRIVILILLACGTALSAQTGGGGGGGTGGVANDIKIWPSGQAMDPGIVGQTYWKYPAFTAQDIHQSNPDNYLTWCVVEGVLPPGLKLIPDGDPVSGVVLGQGVCAIAGVPTMAGSFVFWVKVIDGFSGQVDVQRYSIVIHNTGDFVIKQASVADGRTGTAYSGYVGCTSVGAPFTWSWQAAPGSQLPPGITLDTSSISTITTLTGTPTTAGVYEFIVTVSNGSEQRSRTLRMEVDSVALAIVSPNPLASAQQGVYYGFQFEAEGGVKPYRWLCDNLPAGFTLHQATGFLNVEAPQPGTYTFDVTVWDAAPNQGGANAHVTSSFSLTVNGAGGGALAITTPANLPDAVEGSAYQQTLAASGGTPTYTWSSANLPAGFTLTTLGVLSAPAPVAGTYSFDVTVTDAVSTTDNRAFTLIVNSPSAGASTNSGGSGCAAMSGGAMLPLLVLLAVRRRREKRLSA